MAVPKQVSVAAKQQADANFALNGEFYLNDKDGRTHIRLPAGGTGGGVTQYADVLATDEQHVAFLDSRAKLREDEAVAHRQMHKDADAEMAKKTELYLNADDGRVRKREPGAEPNVLDPLASPDEEAAFRAQAAGKPAPAPEGGAFTPPMAPVPSPPGAGAPFNPPRAPNPVTGKFSIDGPTAAPKP
jgi:hypothetical protein